MIESATSPWARRSFATALACAGVESTIRKRLIGHAANYIEREMAELREAVCRIKLDHQKADASALVKPVAKHRKPLSFEA